jgi:hypothetical protein
MLRVCMSETSGSVDAVCRTNSLFESILMVDGGFVFHKLVFLCCFGTRQLCPVCLRMRKSVCVCVREREGETERDGLK